MAESDFRILLVEDDEHMALAVQMALEPRYVVTIARSLLEGQSAMRAARPDLLLLDLNLPDGSGESLLRDARRADPGMEAIVLTGSQDVAKAVEVMKLGAQDYLQKPFAQEDLLLCVGRAFEKWKLRGEVHRLRSELYGSFQWGNIVAESAAMRPVLDLARRMARSDTTVLITGESGTGKDLIAHAIHCEGGRANGPFVAVNCAQFSSGLLESELFGHEKGAFTGAVRLRRGRFELADAGTLFLDEIGNTTLEMQARILHTVESRRFERVGGERSLHSDFRLIAATNSDVEEAVRKGDFREDLYYRLNVVRIAVPPLRERPEDIPALCEHFLARLAIRRGRLPRRITPEAMQMLRAWQWLGNVRELQNVLEMADALEDGEQITSQCFPMRLRAAALSGKGAAPSANVLTAMVEEFERHFLAEQLRAHNWNQLRTAQSLGAHRNTIDKKIRKYGLTRTDTPPQ